MKASKRHNREQQRLLELRIIVDLHGTNTDKSGFQNVCAWSVAVCG
jgi:hypothetical protein